jgi:hypothetical protein
MKRLKIIYAMVLAVIYITATSLSSISILSCDHHHHHHHHHHATEHAEAECHCESCGCVDMVAIGADCCDHHHPVLGDNHTDFFVNNERNDLRTIISLSLLTTPAILAEAYGDVDIYSPSFSPLIYGDEVLPPRVAAVGTKALRAPPTLA